MEMEHTYYDGIWCEYGMLFTINNEQIVKQNNGNNNNAENIEKRNLEKYCFEAHGGILTSFDADEEFQGYTTLN